ncbi:MAG TPA: GGDEF domain-containing protein [Rhizomicrobium sp.]|nr:GGDEF domain-containing protein [Rhizomicrobium sp.]
MKVDSINTTRGVRAVGAAAYARQVEAVGAATVLEPVANTSVLGIPENEFTPRVRDAIMTLMGEVDSLRQELQQTRNRLEVAEKTADQDQLLPLLNRRAFVRELTRYISLAGRYGTPASLIYFDLDGFKLVNDTHGHAAGDAVLEHFADILQQSVRDSDSVGRLGGDEFGILLSHANQEQAHLKADQLAQKLNDNPTVWNGRAIPMSFSYGAFELKAGDDAATAIARADEAMYAHKRAATR